MNDPPRGALIGLVFVLLINIVSANPVREIFRREGNPVDEGHLRHLLTPEGDAAFRDSLKSLNDAIHSHVLRKLQDLPPPFEPTRACNEFFATTTAEEVREIADLYFLALFPPGSENESLVDVARAVLLSQVKYDIKVAKVCMSCSEARSVVTSEQANNVEKYGFGTYCADGAFGSDAVRRCCFQSSCDAGSVMLLVTDCRPV
jgi:hypothetical protein